MLAADIERTARALTEAYRVFVFAGSGLSAESGLPTFRGRGGIFSDGELQKFISREGFEADPGEVLAWYEQRREELAMLRPNLAHRCLARMAARGEGRRFSVATQNVDRMMERAARKERAQMSIYHLHGLLQRTRCHDCSYSFEDHGYDLRAQMPCPRCDGRLRPDIVWFGEQLPEADLRGAYEESTRADVCLILGTSGLVYPAAQLPQAAREAGALLVEINTARSQLSSLCDIRLRGRASDLLAMLEANMEPRKVQRMF